MPKTKAQQHREKSDIEHTAEEGDETDPTYEEQ